MAFEGLRDQLKEQWGDLSAKIQESTAFNNAREKFESQTPAAQKGITIGAAVLAALFMLWFPFTYFSTSSEYMTTFEENRQLIRGLLSASRSAKTPSPLPPPLDSGALRGRVDAVLRTNRLLPEQIGEMADLPAGTIKDIPASVVQTGIAVQLRKLNLTQIVQLSTQFQNMGGGIKVMGLDVVQSSGQTHYYDLIVKVVNFGLPAIADSGPDKAESAGGKRGARPNRPAVKDEDL